PPASTPATVSTPGIVAGAPTCVVPLPRLPAAATTTTLFSVAYRNASSQLSGQSIVLRVSDMLMMSAPLSTDQRTAAAIWSSELVAPSPNPIDTERMDAAGAEPMTPESAPVPRPAASEATIVPWSEPVEPT